MKNKANKKCKNFNINEFPYLCLRYDGQEHRYAAQSIEEIIISFIKYYDNEAKEITVKQENGNFVVQYLTKDSNSCDWDEMIFGGIEDFYGQKQLLQIYCEFEANVWDAAIFLGKLSEVYGLQENFGIVKNKQMQGE